ncbi:CHAT domain-containing protein [bacterium]|nr:CHAT domain-containing protein [bacterium]
MSVTTYEQPHNISPERKADYTIRISMKKHHIEFDVMGESKDWIELEPKDIDNCRNDFHRLNQLLSKLVSYDATETSIAQNVQLQLQAIGIELAQQFVSEGLLLKTQGWDKNAIVEISINQQAQIIPWELVYDGSDFWGNKFLIVRKPRRRERPQPLPPTLNTVSTQACQRKPIHIIGARLDQYPQVKSLFSEHIRERLTASDVADSLFNAGIIHLTCHGHLSEGEIQLELGSGPFHHFTPRIVPVLPDLKGSLVFINACTSAACVPFLGIEVSFAWSFYEKGASSFLGTISTVPINYALDFAAAFYERFMDGATVVEALIYARQQAPQQNPFWLFYTLYGQAFVTANYVLRIGE